MNKDILPPERVTNDPSNADSRIFVGNIDMSITRTDLEDKFAKYGVLAVTVLKGYGFVQFGSPDDAQEAIDRENSTELKGRQLILKVVNQARGQRRGGRSMRGPPSPPQRNGGGGGGREPRHRERPASMERKRPHRDPSPAWRERNTRPRHSFDRPAPVDIPDAVLCELVVLSRESRRFATEVEDMLLSEGCSVDILVPPMGSDLNQLMDQISMRGTPHALVLQPNCEMSRMVSINILHKDPPEIHHNIPIQHALQLLRESSVMYRAKLLSGQLRRRGAAGMSDNAGKLHSNIFSLLDMVRNEQQLTTDEYNMLIRYLEDKRDGWDSGMFQQWPGSQGEAPKPVPPPLVQAGDNKQQQQLDLQQKILSLMQAYNKGPMMGAGGIGGAPDAPRGVPPPNQMSWNNRRF